LEDGQGGEDQGPGQAGRDQSSGGGLQWDLRTPAGSDLGEVRERNLPALVEGQQAQLPVRLLARGLIAHFGDKPLDGITVFEVEKFKRERRAGNTIRGGERSAASVNRERDLLSKIFRLAKIKDNPCREVAWLREDNRRVRYLTIEEEDRLRPLLVGAWAHLYPLVVVALNTGLRRGELFNLKKDHVDFHLDVVNVLSSKSGKPRSVPIEGETRELLKALCEDGSGEYVFPSTRTGGRFREVRKAFASACRAAEITGFTFHCLRHTFGTRLADQGVDVVKIMELMGHSAVTTTMRYLHASSGGKREVIAKLAGYREQERNRCRIVALEEKRSRRSGRK